MNNFWYKGFVLPFWNDSYKNLEYYRKPLHEDQISAWRESGYKHDSFTGAMFDNQEKIPNWTKTLSSLIGLKNCGYTFYKMSTGDIMPTHVDHFTKYCEIFNLQKHQVWRAVVVLTDWRSGHYFEIDGNPFVNYKAGEYVCWSGETPHSAANIGIQDRYTLQITGTRDESN